MYCALTIVLVGVLCFLVGARASLVAAVRMIES